MIGDFFFKNQLLLEAAANVNLFPTHPAPIAFGPNAKPPSFGIAAVVAADPSAVIDIFMEEDEKNQECKTEEKNGLLRNAKSEIDSDRNF